MNYFSNLKLVIFDLDNTLICEEDYLFEAYKNIANYLSKKYLINSTRIESYLIKEFKSNGRSNLFDKMLNKFKIKLIEIPNILCVLREFKPKSKINLIYEMRIILEKLKSLDIPYIILTNGNQKQQKNKINNIYWGNLLPFVIYANDIKPKPSIESFMNYFSKYNNKINPEEILMIGDSIEDKLFAKNLGCKFKYVTNLIKNNNLKNKI